jgi:pimeloyl-ACP methyl ester carboxylesterase/DNA-binding CsgD family transcriptional regulator
MTRTAQNIRFCTSRDGVRIAYATCGEGPPLVRAGQWITHLEADWDNLVWRPWLEELSRRHALIRYDMRGCGLSDREGVEFSLERYAEDFEAVIEAVGVQRFALLGMSGGGAIAVAYAAAHADRVSHLVLYGAYTRGRIARSTTAEEHEENETLLRLIELGWGKEDPTFRQLFASQYLTDGTAEQLRSFNELMRLSASPANAVKLMRAWYTADVRALAPQIRCPTLVLHPREDLRVPFEEGRSLARLIPGARFVPLDSRNHILLEQDGAWKQLVAELEAFLPTGAKDTPPLPKTSLEGLTPREHDVLDLVARGLSNDVIGGRLGMSEKTVRNHVSAIFSKLGVNTRSEAIVNAREKGFGRAGSG